MIIVIDGINAPKFQNLLRQTYKLRARVFRDRLGWDVKVEDGCEKDVFDTLSSTTLVSLNDAGDVVGSMRILQTMGPNMLADVFFDILQGAPAPRSPLIWEATRFCVDTDKLSMSDSPRSKTSISHVTSEIMIAACEYAMGAGVEDAVAVIDPIMNRILKRSGNAPYDYLGKPTPMGKVTAMAALLDCSEARANSVREFAGISGDVFLAEDDAIALFGDKAKANAKQCESGVNVNRLRHYCAQQFAAAQTPSDIKAVFRLISKIDTEAGPPHPEQAITHVSP